MHSVRLNLPSEAFGIGGSCQSVGSGEVCTTGSKLPQTTLSALEEKLVLQRSSDVDGRNVLASLGYVG